MDFNKCELEALKPVLIKYGIPTTEENIKLYSSINLAHWKMLEKKEISREEFADRIKNNTLLEVTNNVPVHKGDVFFIESGTLHAIGKGILIAEIQQNSNTTYRVYDYGRVGKDGKPRELHIEKAIDVTELCPPKYDTKPQGKPVKIDGGEETLLRSCEYFDVHKIKVSGTVTLDADEKSFMSVLVLDGSGKIGELDA